MNTLKINFPRIAVVIPVYNTEPYLKECLDSVLDQTMVNFMVFAVDDGSTDGSGAILEDYAQKDPRLVVLHQENKGQSAARNRALDQIEADGQFEFVAFVDSDDIVVPYFLERLVSVAQTAQADITACGYYLFNNAHERLNNDKETTARSLSRDEFVELIFSSLRWKDINGRGGMVCTKLFKVSLLQTLRFPQVPQIIEDEPFCLLASAGASQIRFIPDRLYGYRQRKGSLIHSNEAELRHFKSYGYSMTLAKTISAQAQMITVQCFVKFALYFFSSQTPFPTVNFVIPKQEILRAASLGWLTRRQVSRFFLYCEHPILARAYLIQRRIMKSLRFWKKRTPAPLDKFLK